MFCKQCAANLPEGTLFCTGCGTAVGSAPPAPRPTGDGPMPPDLHWAAVVVLSIVTFGLFWLFWNFKVARFVKKIDPTSNAVKQAVGIVAVVALQAAVWVILIVAAFLGNSDFAEHAGGLDRVFDGFIGLIDIFMVIGMRKSLLRQYNSVEPIGLKLNEVLTIVFGVVYFQFHFSNIAAWKKGRAGTVPVQAGAPLSPAS